jgi:hypothetical protein
VILLWASEMHRFGKRPGLALGFKRVCLGLTIRNCELQSTKVSGKDPSMTSPEFEIIAEFQLEKGHGFGLC